MHLQTLAACTLAAIAACESIHTASATASPRSSLSHNVPSNFSNSNVTVSALPPSAITEPGVGAIAQATPETLSSLQTQSNQQASSSLETAAAVDAQTSSTTQYYQDYQPIVAPATAPLAAPTSPPSDSTPAVGSDQPAINFGAPLSSTVERPPTQALPTKTSLSEPLPTEMPPGASPASINAPIWVVPSQQATTPETAPIPDIKPETILAPGERVTVPALPSATPVTPPSQRTPAPRGTIALPDLVVTATDVQIVGAEAELQQVVRNTVKTQPGGGTSSSQLKQDVADILGTGLFANASVSSRTNPQGLSVVFQVEPIIVRSLRLTGAQALTVDVANQLFGEQLGTAVRPTLLNESVRRINEWYAQNGYSLARVLTLQPTREGVITVEVAEGYVGDVQVRFVNKEGNPVDEQGQPIRGRTQPGFLRRQIKLQPGQVFREDVARTDLRRLSELGIFDGANVSFEGDARRVAVIYNVVEASARRVNFSGGYNDEQGLFASINFQDNNFGGLGQRFSTNIQPGTLDTQFDARFDSPYRDTDPNTPGYGANVFRRQGLSRVFDDDIKLPNGSRARERKIGVGIDATKPLSPTWRGTLGLSYTNVSLRDREGDVFARDERGNPLSLSGTGTDDLTTLSFTAIQDLRDNIVNPSRGSVVTLSTEQSIPIGRGEVLGNRLQANYATFIPVGLIKPNADAQQPQVVAFNLQGGTTIGDLPPYNAYVLGGPNSVRGYGAGDLATSRSYFLASAEYRFPLYRFIGGVVFADFASDLGSSDEVLGEPGIQRGKPGTGAGFGLGLRVNSPFGIIRADFGVSNQGDSRFQLGFGQRF
ncbi:BamA/TamA family outer membrane protein [Leptolyngbya sp. FACHB-321]|uniref:BamA/TamA family outer membrane protein n=1 Tax=Leptolyngbya sp. FACHB-321 TaxID=2692807 RepID=UPI001684C192|nr:BamA/TamA family outer membrane protein [Leptolyngbya sp. FACHB-321]MBD2035290.1 BamA/TamA family outer membrane protein [Leptolyngbya sp. FACHB-321]